MRNLMLVVGALTFVLIGCSSKEESSPAAAASADMPTAEQLGDDAETVAAVTPGDENKIVEAVEESAGDEPEAESEQPHNLRLASSGGAKQKAVSSRFEKGVHYREIVPAQPTVTGSDKIEIVEIFWYGCGHCFAFDPYIKKWQAGIPADVEFVRLPAVWNDTLRRHAKAFYTAQMLAKSGALKRPGDFHDAFFNEIHVNRKPLSSDRSVKAFFERFGVSSEDYDKAAGSFEVDQNLRKAVDLTRRYGVTGVPLMVVNGRYASLSSGFKGYEDYLELVDDLVAMER